MISGLKRKLQLCGALIGIVLLLCAVAVPLSAAGDDTAAWYADCLLPVTGCVQVHTYLHVRNGPSVRHEIIDALTNGTEVSVEFITGEWGFVRYGAESTGWVCLRYVAPSGGDAAYPAVQIRTADYKQYDRRWASLEVGRSGKTVRQIGCTLTCAAMTESLRLGRSVTPAEIVRCSAFTQCTFSSTSSRRMAWESSRILTECTQISLRSWLEISRACLSSVSTSMVMRETAGSWVAPTASDSML